MNERPSIYVPCPGCNKRVRSHALPYHQKAYCSATLEARQAEREAARERRFALRAVTASGFVHTKVLCALPGCGVEITKALKTHRCCTKKHARILRTRSAKPEPRASKPLRTCAAPECDEQFAPRSAQQVTYSGPCLRAYNRHKVEMGIDADQREQELAMIRRAAAEVTAEAAAAYARMRSPEERLRLWAACLEIPALAA